MNKKRGMAAAALVAALVLAVAGGWYYRHAKYRAGGEEIQGTTPIATGTGPSSTAAVGGGGNSPKPSSGDSQVRPPKLVNDVTASSLTYTQAVAIFANTLIAFNEECKMVPNPVFVHSGTTLMFDNRSRDARTFKLDGTSYTIPGYGFKLFQLKSTKLPHVVKVQCGPNTGEITLQ